MQTLSVWKSLKFVVWERVKTDENGGKFSKEKENTVEQEGHDGPISLHWLILGNFYKT